MGKPAEPLLRFLDRRHADCPACVECLEEYVPGSTRCAGCGSALVPGPKVETRVAELFESLTDVREARELEEGDDVDDEDAPAQETCLRCGGPIDPDEGACERCLDEVSHAPPPGHAGEPAPEEREWADRVRAWLEEEHDPDAVYCPGCLVAYAPHVAVCRACGKETAPALAVVPLVMRQVADVTDGWPVAVADGRNPQFAGLAEWLRRTLEAEGIGSELRTGHRRDPMFLQAVSTPVLLVAQRHVMRARELAREWPGGLIQISRRALDPLPARDPMRRPACGSCGWVVRPGFAGGACAMCSAPQPFATSA